ncbi:MAG: hypothetical protein C0606_06370 [Hyphomicrobiales bacterium]|nr:MAG: hypothetical protein C0606_06370 [Hyphomicrobiales bacterium]
MAADELTAPLGVDKTPARKSWYRRLPFGLIGIGLVFLVGAGTIMWTTVVEDPLGGEPVVVLDVAAPGSSLGKPEVAVVEIQPQDNRVPNGAQGLDSPLVEGLGRPGENGPVQSPALRDGPLSTAPIPKISEKTRTGVLPKVAGDGSRALDLYAAGTPARSANMPKVAIVVGGLGLSQTGTQQAIRKLPKGVTLAFSPYGNSLDRWMKKAREDGHELLLQVPLEPYDFPQNDPGPHTLLTSLKAQENIGRLHWVMTRLTNYVGIASYMGARFTASGEAFSPVMEEIGRRGLMYLDDGSSTRSIAASLADATRTPFARTEITLDATPTPEEIDLRLLQLESLARSRGAAVGSASSLPVSIERINQWAETLERRGIALVPISVVVKQERQ